ncbi:flagellar hook protein FlgE [Halomonas mongoliensis]|uniref:Flagellar hook protein FlgE n=1 Tax=Halomonas mongoliensis TaxID=321265 RepID=A0ABU1GNG0_9GAMM|nr:flagellar hook protein FlgE [Halomonas mongoliensis]MDR5893365.1 flagellar hook protein FlgE [Halomonas mongoliensis]
MGFSQALSGLSAQDENLKIISNNIANSQTVGFKSSKASFADVFAGASSRVGLGTSIAAVRQDFTAGDLENTGRNLDLAVAGDGFYRLQKPTGEIVFSRNGQFSQDANGFLVNANGMRLTGYGLSDANDPFSEVIAGGAPQAIRIPGNDIPANATTEASATFNFDASIDPTDASLLQRATVTNGELNDGGEPVTQEVPYHFASSFTTYDSLGNERVITTYFRKVDDNTWQAHVALDGQIEDFALVDQNPQLGENEEYDFNRVANWGANAFELRFDANGQLTQNNQGEVDAVVMLDQEGTEIFTAPTSAAALAFVEIPGGADDLEFNFDLLGSTQFNNNSVQNSLTQNGYTSGTLVGIEVQDDGTVVRNYTNEQSREAGQIVLATFANMEGLQPDGDNGWRATNESGEPVLGIAGTGMFGTIASGVLENSNVDLARELVNMIVAQRAYQANSSSIGTRDELLQTVINL